MIDKTPYTPGMREVLKLSKAEAGRMGHDYIGPGHYLLAIIRKGDGLAVETLTNLDIDLEILKEELERQLAVGEGPMVGLFAPNAEAKRALEGAREVANSMKHGWVGTEHLLLALAREEEWIPGKVLKSLGITFEKAKREVTNVIEGSSSGRPPTESPAELARVADWLFAPVKGVDLISGELLETIESVEANAARGLHPPPSFDTFVLDAIRRADSGAVKALGILGANRDELDARLDGELGELVRAMGWLFMRAPPLEPTREYVDGTTAARTLIANLAGRAAIYLCKEIARSMGLRRAGSEQLLLAALCVPSATRAWFAQRGIEYATAEAAARKVSEEAGRA